MAHSSAFYIYDRRGPPNVAGSGATYPSTSPLSTGLVNVDVERVCGLSVCHNHHHGRMAAAAAAARCVGAVGNESLEAILHVPGSRLGVDRTGTLCRRY